MDKIRSWLVRHRDQTAVSYSRFGRPGEEQDDRPPPTTIIVAPFDENSPAFICLQCWHIQKAAAAVACFGMSMVILTFISGFFEFNWYSHSRGVDISALLFMFAYLAVGVLTHYYVLYGLKKQNHNYLIPFITIYSMLCSIEFIIILSIIFKIMEVESENHHSFLMLAIGTGISVGVQLLMLIVVVRCRQFLSLKMQHEQEMSVAERSKAKNPSLQIIIASDNGLESVP